MIRGIRLATAAALLAGPVGPVFAAVGTASVPRAAAQPAGAKTSAAQGRTAEQLKLQQYFEANRGQTDRSVKFFTRAGGYNLYLTPTESVMVTPAGPSAASGVVRMKLKGANPSPVVQGLEVQPGYTNYLIGDSSRWRTGVKHYGKVQLTGVYPGIDMVYRFDKGQVEYDFVVAPGAKPWRIILGFEGAKDLRLDAKGNLLLRTGTGEVTYKAPYLYQTLGSKRVPVKGRFVLAANNHVRFEVGNYIESKELVIDPALNYSSFLGGSVDDYANALAVDTAGNAYVTGYTQSADFSSGNPVGAGQLQPGLIGGKDVFVTKVNPAGTAVLWSTYYGAAGDEVANGIGVDGTGKVYITGSTTGTLPATTPAPVTLGTAGGTDAFLVALNAAGTAVVYARQFGGPQVDSGNGIAVDAAGNAYVTGVTASIAINSFPTTALSAQPNAVAGAQTDAFVAKFSPVGNQVYASYLGDTGIDKGNAIAIDGAGNAYIAGQAGDAFVSVIGYPTVFKNTVTGASDSFIVKMDPTGANFVYKTFVGGSGIDEATGIAVDSLNSVYITGYTFSADFPDGNVAFPTIGQTTIGTAPDAFVFKLKPFNGGGHNDGVYATYLGGSGDDRANAIVVDNAFYAYVTGTTYASDFPMVSPIAEAATLVGAPEAFVTQIGPTGGVIGFSTFLGGTTMTGGQGIALDTSKNIFVTGWTNSTAPTFPVVAGSFQVANAGAFDAFITKFGSAVPPLLPCNITNVNPVSGFTVGGTTVSITGTDFVAYSGPGGVTFDGVNAQSYTVNAASTVITAVTPRHPLVGPLTAGPVTLSVTTTAGSCTATYTYVLSPLVGGACVDEYFFPSPVKGATGNFAYCMAQAGTARIKVYNSIGDLVTKIEDSRGAGAQLSQINTGRLSSGVYLYRLEKDYGGGNSVTSDVKKFVVRH